MRCILAVSGTLQEGFPLRKNLDAPGAPAVHLGSGLVRGVRSYLDVKERGCREFGNAPNPACVVTGDAADGNVYELYLVDGAACLGALLGEPRFLAMAPDAVVLDLEAAETCDAVRKLTRHVLGDAGPALLGARRRQRGAGSRPAHTPSDRAAASVLRRARRSHGSAGCSRRRAARQRVARRARRPAERAAVGRGRRSRHGRGGLAEAAAAPTRAAARPSARSRRPPRSRSWRGAPPCAARRGAILSSVAHRLLARRAVRQVWAAGRREAVKGAADAPADAAIPCRHGRQFKIARSDTALVCIDLQRDFVEATGRIGGRYADLKNVDAAVQKASELLKAARAAGLTIAHSRSHRYGATIRDDLIGDPGYELCDACRARDGEIVVDKWTFGAFASTDLEARLRQRGVRRILLCGVLTNVCVMATAVQAVDRFFRVCLVEDACAAFDPSWHAKAVDLINEPQVRKGHADQPVGLYFGEVSSSQEVVRGLRNMTT